MKKAFIALVSCMFLLCGCSYEKYDIGTDMVVSYYTIEPAQWVKENTGVGYQYYCTIRNKDINKDVIEDGAVLAYYIDPETGLDHLLQYSFPVRIGRTTEKTTQNIRFEVKRGEITFVIEWADGVAYDIEEPYEFKVCVMAPGERIRN